MVGGVRVGAAGPRRHPPRYGLSHTVRHADRHRQLPGIGEPLTHAFAGRIHSSGSRSGCRYPPTWAARSCATGIACTLLNLRQRGGSFGEGCGGYHPDPGDARRRLHGSSHCETASEVEDGWWNGPIGLLAKRPSLLPPGRPTRCWSATVISSRSVYMSCGRVRA